VSSYASTAIPPVLDVARGTTQEFGDVWSQRSSDFVEDAALTHKRAVRLMSRFYCTELMAAGVRHECYFESTTTSSNEGWSSFS